MIYVSRSFRVPSALQPQCYLIQRHECVIFFRDAWVESMNNRKCVGLMQGQGNSASNSATLEERLSVYLRKLSVFWYTVSRYKYNVPSVEKLKQFPIAHSQTNLEHFEIFSAHQILSAFPKSSESESQSTLLCYLWPQSYSQRELDLPNQRTRRSNF